MNTKVSALGLFLLLTASPVKSQDDICPLLFAQGYYDTNRTFTTEQNYAYAYNLICSDKSMTYQNASNSGFNLGINIPQELDLALGGTTNDSNFTSRRDQFCQLGTTLNTSNSSLITMSQQVSKAAVTAMLTCLTRDGFHVVLTPSSTLNGFSIRAVNNQSGDNTIGHVSIDATPSGAIACHGVSSSQRYTSPHNFLCDKPVATTVLVTFNSDRGEMKGTEVLGTDRIIPDLEAAVSALQAQTAQQAASNQSQFTAINNVIGAVKSGYGSDTVAVGSNTVGSNGVGSATIVRCPAGTYMAGMTVGFSGTCYNQCRDDGAVIKQLTPICRPLFP